MHLIFENVVPLLLDLWSGQSKHGNEEDEPYVLQKSVLTAIAEAVAASGDTIPSIFGRRLPHPFDKRYEYTAEAWMLWVQHIAPTVLHHRFENDEYYRHFVRFATLVNKCLAFTYPQGFFLHLRNEMAGWVSHYERLYYRGQPARVGLCPSTIHALLHIAQCVEQAGPVWVYWAFPMERYCGLLQRSVTGHNNPYPSIDRRAVEIAQLDQLKLLLNMPQLGRRHRLTNETGAQFESYPNQRLLPPQSIVKLAGPLRTKVIQHLTIYHGLSQVDAQDRLPGHIQQWGKVQLRDGSGSIHALQGLRTADRRDMTFVRYHAPSATESAPLVAYGQLQHVFELAPFGAAQPVLLAIIRRCIPLQTGLRLASLVYEQLGAMEVIDLGSVDCVVGRIPDKRGHWTIIERSEGHYERHDDAV
ncbi:hypothetical protein CALVIDRAFT_489785 [Calocera viscosa TUFC12733]|uniref:Uncharacterized protein n=1 Tax=Calocera viscosa (strain TUFC12733) TaxID=1330018 RepID=A0A167GV11_CALVF|nr:hypothetical protein CALVIDRAFT_489785 [Calocera viscosa TUFC12733]